jgi:branched-chain amino acid transport system substrate-binding protein
MLAAVPLAVLLALGACSKEEPPPPAPQASAPPPAPTQTVKIGIVAPLTGPQAHIGKDMENAVRMAAEDANAAKMMVPTNIRDTAKAVPLNKFSAEQVRSFHAAH